MEDKEFVSLIVKRYSTWESSVDELKNKLIVIRVLQLITGVIKHTIESKYLLTEVSQHL